MNGDSLSPIVVSSPGTPVQVDVVGVAQQGPKGDPGFSGTTSLYMQDTAPALAAGTFWFDTTGLQLYVCYDDLTGLQWVIANNVGGSGGGGGGTGPAGPAGPAGPTGPAGAPGGSALLTGTGIVANAQVGATPLPANGVLLNAVVRETAGHAVSISLGTTLGGTNVTTDVVAVPANGLVLISLLSLGQIWWSATATQAIFVSSTAWGGASVNVEVAYQAGP